MERLMRVVIGKMRTSRQDLRREVGMKSREQVALEEDKIAERTSAVVAGRKDERRGGWMGGGRWREEEGREEEEKEEVSLRILSPKKFKKEVARREGEEEGGRGETDLRERRESREDHNLLGSLEV